VKNFKPWLPRAPFSSKQLLIRHPLEVKSVSVFTRSYLSGLKTPDWLLYLYYFSGDIALEYSSATDALTYAPEGIQ